MSLLGIDIGTIGCKAVVFSLQGVQLARSYRDYEIISEREGYAELDSVEIWNKIKEAIREVAGQTQGDPIQALSVSSLGEAMVPVSQNRQILGNSILGSDQRGAEFAELIQQKYSSSEIFRITGNLPGTFYSMPKIGWIKKNRPDLYDQTKYFMTWADFVCFMLGGKPITNFSLAGRSLLFDIHSCKWSDELFSLLGLDQSKFPDPLSSGYYLGNIDKHLARELNLNSNVAIVSGSHDQCCAALGSGVKSGSKSAMYGMGTYMVVVPSFVQMPDIQTMYTNKLHIEHHAVPGSFISFIYNQSGGGMVKWFKQTFCMGIEPPTQDTSYSYDAIFAEMPDNSTDILVLPGFGATGPPDFENGGKGCIYGLSLNHSRGDILQAMLEGISFYFRDFFEDKNGAFTNVNYLTATGGGSVSKKWLQITSDILGKPIIRNKVSEASALGAAIIAGIGINVFTSFDEAIDSMVHQDLTISPDFRKNEFYTEKFQRYKNQVKQLKQ
ncbi:MAG TPA: FGGY-family carbohydrate kinase [Prolixibacteraceae bacterium]|nr:FGGY-family carbohydrate kinase [Prolixibacteraceae bacterium]